MCFTKCFYTYPLVNIYSLLLKMASKQLMTTQSKNGGSFHINRFPMVFHRFPMVFPYKSPFSHGFPMVFPWFSHRWNDRLSLRFNEPLGSPGRRGEGRHRDLRAKNHRSYEKKVRHQKWKKGIIYQLDPKKKSPKSLLEKVVILGMVTEYVFD